MKSFIQFINEVTIIGKNPKPLKDSDTVRVYHGTSDVDTIIVALTKGLTGGTRANRKYSYESNNNPKGLFVTPDIHSAKQFGDYVIEFHVRVNDLESPVWPGGTFTVQGGISGVFNSEDDREAERLKQRMKWSTSEYEFVANSDRPELAALFLMGGERQALFTGDLNSNSIRAIWVSSDPTRINQKYNRMSTKEFMKMADNEAVPTRFGTKVGLEKRSDVARKSRKKIVSPRDHVTGDQLIVLLSKKHRMDPDRVEDLLKKNPQLIKDYVWNDRQYNQVMYDLEDM